MKFILIIPFLVSSCDSSERAENHHFRWRYWNSDVKEVVLWWLDDCALLDILDENTFNNSNEMMTVISEIEMRTGIQADIDYGYAGVRVFSLDSTIGIWREYFGCEASIVME